MLQTLFTEFILLNVVVVKCLVRFSYSEEVDNINKDNIFTYTINYYSYTNKHVYLCIIYFNLYINSFFYLGCCT